LEERLRLSLQTDLSLRALMYLAANDGRGRVSTAVIAERYGVSKFHLQKAIQVLRRLGYVGTTPGRLGGLRLAMPADRIRLGALVAALEGVGCLVDCDRGPCPLRGACLLKGVLDRAERTFIRELDKHVLADVVAGATGGRLKALLSA
jgi:Rrf2 family transcriptional regulator, nitric oxide-sensitive transcriptional repressor